MVNEDIPEAVILEDDALIRENFLEEFDQIYQDLPKDYDFLHLFVHPDTDNSYDSNDIREDICTDRISPECSLYGTVGYLITQNIAKELLNLFSQSLNRSIDETICWYLKQYNKKYFCVNTNLVETSGDLFRYTKEQTELGSMIKRNRIFQRLSSGSNFLFRSRRLPLFSML